MIVLDGKAVIGLFVFDEETGKIYMRVESVSRDDFSLQAQLGEIIREPDGRLRVEKIGHPRARLPVIDENAIGVLRPTALPGESHLLEARGRLQDEAPLVGSRGDDFRGKDGFGRALRGKIMGQLSSELAISNFCDGPFSSEGLNVFFKDIFESRLGVGRRRLRARRKGQENDR